MATEGTAEPIRAALDACRAHLRSTALFSACLNILQIVPTLYMLQVYDRAVPSRSGATLAFLTLILLVALATLSLLDLLRGKLLVRAGILLDHKLAPLIVRAAMEHPSGATARQALREFDQMRAVMTGPATLALFDAPWAPVYVIACFIVHPYIGLMALVGMIILPIIVWRSERMAGPALVKAQEEAAVAYLIQDQMLASAPSLRALGMSPALVHRQIRVRRAMMNLQSAANFGLSGYSSMSKFVRLSLQSLGLGLGALLAMDNLISAGAIFAASFLISRALAPIEQMIGTWKSLVQARAAYNNINGLLAESAPDPVRTQLPPPQGAIALEQVSFQRPGRETNILEEISFSIEAGEVLAIVGPSGAGKSTLLSIIAGVLAPTSGIVRFDGASQEDWDSDRLGTVIGLLPQSSSLLAGTIKENISRFRTEFEGGEALDRQVLEAAARSGAHDLILQLDGGYDYLVGHGGGNLSSGQAQRIALARALFGAPSIVLLDEPNAHLDNEGDAKLAAAIKELKERKASVVIVSHRLSILPVVDKMLLLQGGKVQAFGPRDQVMARIMPSNVRPVQSQSQQVA